MTAAMTLENTVGSRRCSHRRGCLAPTSMMMTAMLTTMMMDERNNNNNNIRNNSSHDDDDDNDDDHLPQPKTRSQTNVQYEPNYWVEEEPLKASKPRKKRAKYTPEPEPPKVPKPRKKKAKYTPVPVEEEEGYW